MKSRFALLALTLFTLGAAPGWSMDAADEPLVVEAPTFAHDAGRMSPRKAQRLVTLLYRAALFREPDPQGLAAWSQQVLQGGYAALVESAAQIGASPEYYSNVLPYHSAYETLNNMYWHLLRRQPDPSGTQAYLPYLEQGQAGVVMRAIVSSPEFASLWRPY